MTDELDEIFSKNPELEKMADELFYGIMPHIIELLVFAGKIDKNQIDDPVYIWSVIMENKEDVVNSLRYRQRFDNQLIETARDAIKQDRIPVAVILVATSLEHVVNIFYREILEKRYKLTPDEATDAIRSNFQTKLSWLLKILSNHEISDEFRKRVKQIMDLRNALVHYKALGSRLDEVDKVDSLIEQAQKIGLEVILNMPSDLEKELASVLEKILPEYELTDKIAETLIRFKEKRLSQK